jgi:hypothetical protein
MTNVGKLVMLVDGFRMQQVPASTITDLQSYFDRWVHWKAQRIEIWREDWWMPVTYQDRPSEIPPWEPWR